MVDFVKCLKSGMPIVALVVMSACSSSSTSSDSGVMSENDEAEENDMDMVVLPDPVVLQRSIVRAENDLDRIVGAPGEICTGAVDTCIPGTAFERIPDEGTAVFRGVGVIDLQRDAVAATQTTPAIAAIDYRLVGEAAITVDFEDVTFTGTVDGLEAMDLQNVVTDSVTGAIAIVDGSQADAERRPTFLEAGAEGNLTTFGETFGVGVGLEGLLRGTNPSLDIPVKAIDLAGETAAMEPGGLTTTVQIATDRDQSNNSYLNP